MKPQRINKGKAIDLILLELQKGSTYSECLAVNGGKWRIPERTFDRYWKEANEAHNQSRDAIKEQIREEVLEAEKERVKKAILTKEERMVEASKIARGEAWRVGKEVVIPNGSDRLKALEYLSKIDGDFAPVRKELTGKDGQDLVPARILTKEEAAVFLQKLEDEC